MLSENELKWCIEHYADMILRVAVNYFGNTGEAEDMVQDVFLRLIENKRKFTDEEHRRRWLIRVTVNMCRNELKSGYKRRVVLTDNDMPMILSDASVMQDEHIEETVRLRAAVAELPEKLRIVVHLFYYEDYAVKEIASILNITESVVLTRLHRARAKLKEKLGGGWEDEQIGTE